MLITIEGGEGSGKSTLIEELGQALVQEGRRVLETREPGGCKLSEQIRDQLLKTPSNTPIGTLAETLLFLAARAQHVEEVIQPALHKGLIVLCDRFNDSTIAYQGYGRGLGGEHVRNLCHAACHLQPDLTLLLEISPEEGLTRASKQKHTPDRIEAEELAFHQRVHAGYLRIAADEPARVKVIDARLSKEEVFDAAYQEISSLLSRTAEAHRH
ncbi:MAG: dTMP kinase [Parachlamydiales bacterium]